jgi:hypothetical protein
MKRMALWVAVVLSAVGGPTGALAGPTLVTYPFTVVARVGPLAGETANGSFTYNSGIVPSGGGLVGAVGLLTNLNFTWDGIAYNASTANTGAMVFDSSGTLTIGLFGNDCVADQCAVNVGAEEWYINTGALSIDYAISAGGFGEGTVTLGTAITSMAVPEPGTLALLALGLALAGFGHRRRCR